MNNFGYLFIFCIDLLTSARSSHSGYARVIPLGKHPGNYRIVLSSGTSQWSICKIKLKIERNLSTNFSLDGKNIILYYSITLANLACTGYFQVIILFVFDDKWP